ncbi:NfeD family protein [Candidatus Hydrogenedentota bacterium]
MLEDFSGLEKFFVLCALGGGVIFVLRLLMEFVGMGDTDVDVDGVDADLDIGDSDISFNLFTLQGLTGFFLMFGLVGLALARSSGVAEVVAIGGGVIAGAAMMFVVAAIYRFMEQLQSSGTLDMSNAVGQEGTVYLTIPQAGTGQAQITVQDHLKIFDAVSEDKKEIKTGERVRVKEVVSGGTLVVERV